MHTGVTVAAVLAVSLGNLLSPFWETASRESKEGVAAYQNQDWTKAADHFRRSLIEEPDPVTSFNLGTAAYKEENWTEAQGSFVAGSGSDLVSKSAASYNLGNVRYKNQDLGGALQAYRSALREDPGDEDARYNYELTLHQLQSQEGDPQNQDQDQQEDQDQQQDQEQQQQQDGEEGESEPSQGGDGEEQENQDQDSASQAGDEDQESPQKQQDDQGQAQEPAGAEEKQLLTPEQAVQLLNAITAEERELIQARLKGKRKTKVEKDW